MSNQPASKYDPLRGIKTGAWSKWGGSRQCLVKEELSKWSCQNCGEEQPQELPSYTIEFEQGEYLRVCSKCKNLMVIEDVSIFATLSYIYRRASKTRLQTIWFS